MAGEGVTIIVPPEADPALVERLRQAFPDAALGAAPAAEEAALDGAAAFDGAVDAAIAATAQTPQLVEGWWLSHADGLLGLATVAGSVAAGLAAERLARALAGPPPEARTERDFLARARAAWGWAAPRLVGLAAFAVTVYLVCRVALPDDAAFRALARDVLLILLRMRAVLLLVEALVAPGEPGRRLMGLDEAGAARARRAAAWVAWISFALLALREVVAAAAPGAAGALWIVLIVAVGGVVMAAFFLVLRRPVAALLLRHAGTDAAGWRGALARNWAWLYVAATALDVALKALGALGLLGPRAMAGGSTLLAMILAPLAIGGLRAWRAGLEEAQEATAGAARRAGLRRGLFALAEGAVMVVGGVWLMRGWGIDPFAAPTGGGLALLAPALVEAAVFAAIGVAMWRAAAALLTAPPAAPPGAITDEEAPRQSTRLGTVMPVLRGFALTAIGLITVLSAFSALGVDITPLLASAGVLGIAIGFGAQKLVTDVISGLFYLYEDAFRAGEYIETKSGKGVVERISLRSVRLRHHRGPVFTIPFSEMGTIQNHSRDWVKVKFTFAVPAHVDVEMVRKLVKKVGEGLVEHPELQGKFLEPLKSQGVMAIQGCSYLIGCKFTARPGQQFVIRRIAYAALQKALEERGIELFMPRLTLAPDDASGMDAGLGAAMNPAGAR